MNENLLSYHLSIFDPDDAAGMSASAWLGMMPVNATLVYASVSPHEDDASATIDIQALDASDYDVPGEWISTHCGGSETPVRIVAGSELEVDANSVAATTRLEITMLFLTGAGWG
jgi:hypothetical protein